ncbi:MULTISPECIES: helix-turn-helix domain-containing protein [Priestia]|uniref:helix-turn-helix domain-containing protein n=1 Tax=Priestia TaxID=2800373 RepID=UPI00112CBAB6|nr:MULTISPECIES: helix-turn-helix domain-containing protein [Priestia]
MKLTANEVKLIRNVYGFSRKQFAYFLNVEPNYIYLIETGRKPLSASLEAKILDKYIVDEFMLIAIKDVGNRIKQAGDKDAE